MAATTATTYASTIGVKNAPGPPLQRGHRDDGQHATIVA